MLSKGPIPPERVARVEHECIVARDMLEPIERALLLAGGGGFRGREALDGIRVLPLGSSAEGRARGVRGCQLWQRASAVASRSLYQRPL